MAKNSNSAIKQGQQVSYKDCWWRVTKVRTVPKGYRYDLDGVSRAVINVTIHNLNGKELAKYRPKQLDKKNYKTQFTKKA